MLALKNTNVNYAINHLKRKKMYVKKFELFVIQNLRIGAFPSITIFLMLVILLYTAKDLIGRLLGRHLLLNVDAICYKDGKQVMKVFFFLFINVYLCVPNKSIDIFTA